MLKRKKLGLSENSIDKIAGMVLQLQSSFSQLSEDDLQNFKEVLKGYKKNSEKFIVEGLAVAREAIYRKTGFYLYKVQLMGALILYQNEIAEMATGEGKTLTAVLVAYLGALTHNNVHVVTVNAYLAKRDSEIASSILEMLGLTVSLNHSGLSNKGKKRAYSADVMYTTNSELGFDCLRDNLALNLSDQVQNIAGFCLIDEVDSILLDEASAPLIISGDAKEETKYNYIKADKFVKSLNSSDVTIDRKYNLVTLSNTGLEKAQKAYSTSNLYAATQITNLHFIKMALTATYLMKKDVQYIVSKNKILLIDEGTGRVQPDKRFSAGLQQAIEAKENMEIEKLQTTLATITYQNFFKGYKNLSGMTGTAFTERREFEKLYGLKVVKVPRHKPLMRIDKPTVLFANERDKDQAIITLVRQLHNKNRPVLIGTASVNKSECLSDLFTQNKLVHSILNAKNDKEEAQIIAHAGQAGKITIATNMAGRGTDIKVDMEAKSAGGLFVLGTELHSSRRIDNQLRGRAGRQGDPGTTQFYISLDDTIIKKFNNYQLEELQKTLTKKNQHSAIKSKHLMKSIEHIQEDIEYSNFLSRKQVAQFDAVVQKQREKAYAWRQAVLSSPLQLSKMTEEQIHKVVLMGISAFCNGNQAKWKKKELTSYLNKISGLKIDLNRNFKNTNEIESYVSTNLLQKYRYQNQFIGDSELIEQFQRRIMLSVFDEEWNDLVDYMVRLRQTILLRGYGQEDPMVQYRIHANKRFQNMETLIAYRVTKLYLCANLKLKEETNAR